MNAGKGTIRPKDNPKPFTKGNKFAEKWNENTANILANELIEWLLKFDTAGQLNENIFFKEFLIIQKGLHPKTISYLSKRFTTFSTLIEKAKHIQEIKLLKLGIENKINPILAKFVLINQHGYRVNK